MPTDTEIKASIEIIIFLKIFLLEATFEKIDKHLKQNYYNFTTTELSKILDGLIADGFVEKQ